MSKWEHTRDKFEDDAFTQRFICGIGKNPNSSFFHVDCPPMAEFIQRDENGEYLDETLRIMWWAWQKAMDASEPKQATCNCKVFYASFNGMYIGGSAVIVADDNDHAMTLLKTRMQGEGLGDEIIYSVDEVDTKLPCVPHFDNGDY